MKCKYCEKECKNLNSLKQHEIRCKSNSNRISKYNGGFKKGSKTWIYKDNQTKLINLDELDLYLSLGWLRGLDKTYRDKLSKSLIGKSIGKASTKEKEIERKMKISNSMKGNQNWKFNKKRGNSKQGWYNNIHCDSTWELAFLVYYLEHNLSIERCKEERHYIFNNEFHKYFPDFVTDEGIIEIKGRFDKKSIEKQKQNPDVIIYDKIKMKDILNYVIDKYGKTFWIDLYDK